MRTRNGNKSLCYSRIGARVSLRNSELVELLGFLGVVPTQIGEKLRRPPPPPSAGPSDTIGGASPVELDVLLEPDGALDPVGASAVLNVRSRVLPKFTVRKVSPRGMLTVRGLAVVARQPLGTVSSTW